MMCEKTMEGLVGARTNMDMTKVPLRVFKEARRRGDTATMERAMGYVNEFSDQAQEYKAEADEGMKEDGKEAKEREKAAREKAADRLKEESEKLEEKMEDSEKDSKKDNGELLTISREGKVLWENAAKQKADDLEGGKTVWGKENVIYTKTGESSQLQKSPDISILV